MAAAPLGERRFFWPQRWRCVAWDVLSGCTRMEILPPPASPEKLSPIVYGLEDKIPLGPALLVGVQQVAAMVVGTITPPLILAGTLKFSQADTAYTSSASRCSRRRSARGSSAGNAGLWARVC